MVLPGTRFSAERKICTPGHQFISDGFRLTQRVSLPFVLHLVIRKRAFAVQWLDARAIQNFFHPQLTILTVDLLTTFLASESCHSRHSATVLNGAVTCDGASLRIRSRTSPVAIFFMVSYPLKPGGIALSGNETVLTCRSNVSGRTPFGANKPWYSLAMLCRITCSGEKPCWRNFSSSRIAPLAPCSVRIGFRNAWRNSTHSRQSETEIQFGKVISRGSNFLTPRFPRGGFRGGICF